MTFGERLKIARFAIKKTQQEFAKEIGVSQITISKMEKNKIMPKVETLIDINRVFNISSMYLLYGIGEMFVDLEDSRITLEEQFVSIIDEVNQFLEMFENGSLPKTEENLKKLMFFKELISLTK